MIDPDAIAKNIKQKISSDARVPANNMFITFCVVDIVQGSSNVHDYTKFVFDHMNCLPSDAPSDLRLRYKSVRIYDEAGRIKASMLHSLDRSGSVKRVLLTILTTRISIPKVIEALSTHSPRERSSFA